jgi:hypothetical protein
MAKREQGQRESVKVGDLVIYHHETYGDFSARVIREDRGAIGDFWVRINGLDTNHWSWGLEDLVKESELTVAQA